MTRFECMQRFIDQMLLNDSPDVIEKKMLNLADTITGEINRICVTHDPKELVHMLECAKDNIEKLYMIRRSILIAQGEIKDV